jgi:hypothetical protein
MKKEGTNLIEEAKKLEFKEQKDGANNAGSKMKKSTLHLAR